MSDPEVSTPEEIIPAKLYTPEQVAAYLQIEPDTLRTWRSRRSRGLNYIKIGDSKGGCVRYRGCDVIAFVASRHRSGLPPKPYAPARRGGATAKRLRG